MAQGEGGSANAGPAYAAVPFYLLSYALVKLGAFTIVSQLGGAGEKNLSLDDYAGLSQRQPWVAAALSVYLLSLLGLPITAGFFGKLYIFKAAVNSHLLWLAVLMAINSVIGAYYYFRLIVVMYMREPSAEAAVLGPVRFPIGVSVVLVVTFAGTILFGVYPNPILNFILQPTLLGR
jgi:NADH-quinone oxidoreductase subunit N